jgi:hypothetical protein
VDYAGLRNLPLEEVIKTLKCISNFVAKPVQLGGCIERQR